MGLLFCTNTIQEIQPTPPHWGPLKDSSPETYLSKQHADVLPGNHTFQRESHRAVGPHPGRGVGRKRGWAVPPAFPTV